MSKSKDPTPAELMAQLKALEARAGKPLPPSGARESHNPQSPQTVDQLPRLSEFQRGQLVILLAIGLTQRETAMWVQTSQSSVSRLFHRDSMIQNEVKFYTELARLNPLLRLYQHAGKSWKAASKLLQCNEERPGPLTTDELIASLRLLQEKVRGGLRE